MTRNAKVMFVVGAVSVVVGVIVCIAGDVTAGLSLKVGFEIEGETSGTMDVGENSGVWGFSVHIKASELFNCDTIQSATTVTDSVDSGVSMTNACSSASVTQEWEDGNDPPLIRMGTFYLNSDLSNPIVKVRGTYTVVSSTEVWVVDSGEEIGEAVGGIMAAVLVLIVGLILAIVGVILCCVGCCCMCTR